MDASSIITQVFKDDDNVKSFINNSNKRELTQRSARSFSGILNSLNCCFRKKSENSISAQSISIEENGQYSSTLIATGQCKYLLPPIHSIDLYKKCMVIDLDETLVHSSFKPISNADFIVPVEIDGTAHQVYVLKRPYVDNFLRRMGDLYECILFTASLAKYADPVADLLDKWGVFRARLFRESCVFHRGNYVKDLGRLGRELSHIVIVDNSPASYIFHPENAVPVSSWLNDMNDTELLDLIPFLEGLSQSDSIYTFLRCHHPITSSNQQRIHPVILPAQCSGLLLSSTCSNHTAVSLSAS